MCFGTFKVVCHHIKAIFSILKVLFQFWTFRFSRFKSNVSVSESFVSIFSVSDSLIKSFFSVTSNCISSLCVVKGFLRGFFSVKGFCKVFSCCYKNGFLETKAGFSVFVSCCRVCDGLLSTCNRYFSVFKFLCFCCKGCICSHKRLVKGLTLSLDLVLICVVFFLKFLKGITRYNCFFDVVDKGFFWKTDNTFTVFKYSVSIICFQSFEFQHFKVTIASRPVINFNEVKNVLVFFIAFT